jgi:hypothetical protein
MLIAVPAGIPLKILTSSAILPNGFTADAARGSSPWLAGVGPKKMQNALPGGQYANSPTSISVRASEDGSIWTPIPK